MPEQIETEITCRGSSVERLVVPDICSSFNQCQGGDYCTKCSHAYYFGSVEVAGRKWNFEFNPHFGVEFLTLGGEPKKVQPSEKNPVWDEFGKWHDAKFKEA